MSSPSAAGLRAALAEELAGAGVVRTDAVRHAFAAVPRELFVPRLAIVLGLPAIYRDRHLVTQETNGIPTSSSSQPSIMAIMLEALQVRPGHRVLEIGLGTGYNAALLSHLAGPRGAVTSVDIDADLVDAASEALRAGGFPVATVAGDGRLGHPARAPYDRIIATASGPTIPRAWWEQLSPDGILVMPLRIGSIQVVASFRRTDAGFRSGELHLGGFMSLRRPGPDGRPVLDEEQPVLTLRAGMPGRAPVEFFVTAPALARMSPDALVELAAHLLRKRSTSSTPIDPAPAWSVVWHITMTADLDRQLGVFEVTGGPAFGLVEPQTGACSILAADQSANLTTIETYGDDFGGAAELQSSVEDWRRRGSPSFSQLAVEIAYDDAAAPEWALRQLRSDGHALFLGWLPAAVD